MRGELRIGANKLKTAKLCILFAFLGAQSLGAQAWTILPANPHIRGADFSLRLHHIPAPRRLKSAPLFFRSLPAVSSTPAFQAEDNCVKCHTQSTGRAEEVVRLHSSSAHGRGGVGCGDCHGGDPTQTDKVKAHSSNFTGKPDRSATLTMCGACHTPQFAQFKTGKHFPEKQGIPRLDCAECHGAHSVGNRPETFSLGQFCVSCHGLEYLPPLPQQFRDLLNLSDDISGELNALAAKGRKLSDEAVNQRKEIRRLTAELVHPTDLGGGIERIPMILTQGERFKQEIKMLHTRRQ